MNTLLGNQVLRKEILKVKKRMCHFKVSIKLLQNKVSIKLLQNHISAKGSILMWFGKEGTKIKILIGLCLLIIMSWFEIT